MANLAAILQGIGGFAQGFANSMDQSQGQNDLGNALSALYGGSNSQGTTGLGGPPSPDIFAGQQPQQQYQGQTKIPSIPMQQPQTSPMSGQGAQPAVSQPSGLQPGQMGPPSPLAAANAMSAQQSGQGVQGQPNLPQPNSTTGAVQALGRGPLTLSSLIGAIKQRNPNISGRALASAVERSLPILNMEGLQQYRDLGLQLRRENEQSLEEDRRNRTQDRRQAERDRLQMSNDRIQAQNQRQQEQIQVRLKGLEQAKTLKEAQMHATALRAAIKDKLEATNHEIQMQYNLTDEQKAELYKQAQDDAKKANDNLDEMLKSKGSGEKSSENNKSSPEGTQAPQSKATAEQKTAWKKQAQDAISSGGDPEWVKQKYKELTGEDMGN